MRDQRWSPPYYGGNRFACTASAEGASLRHVVVKLNGQAVTGTLQVVTVTGVRPTTPNTFGDPNMAAVSTSPSGNVTIPPYGES